MLINVFSGYLLKIHDRILQSDDPFDKLEQLTLYNVTKEDEGWYVCVALNTLGNTTAKGYLTVLECEYLTAYYLGSLLDYP